MDQAPRMRLRDLDDATNAASGAVVDAALEIHQRLGPGLYEDVYKRVLTHVLRKRGHVVERERPIAVHYDDLVIPNAYFADLVVDGKVIVEAKAVAGFDRAMMAQLTTYLRFTGVRVGLLINFDADALKFGLRRIVL